MSSPGSARRLVRSSCTSSSMSTPGTGTGLWPLALPASSVARMTPRSSASWSCWSLGWGVFPSVFVPVFAAVLLDVVEDVEDVIFTRSTIKASMIKSTRKINRSNDKRRKMGAGVCPMKSIKIPPCRYPREDSPASGWRTKAWKIMQNRLLATMAPTKGWLRVGSSAGDLEVKKMSSTTARTAKRSIEQLKHDQTSAMSRPR